MPVSLRWAAETVQRLKLLYVSDPVAFEAFVKNGRCAPGQTRIGELDEDQRQFVVDVAAGLTRDAFVRMPLRTLLERALEVLLDG